MVFNFCFRGTARDSLLSFLKGKEVPVQVVPGGFTPEISLNESEFLARAGKEDGIILIKKV